MGRITDYLRGTDLIEAEGRTITRGTEAESLPPVASTALPAVRPSTALLVADVFATVRTLADLRPRPATCCCANLPGPSAWSF